jgi:hypothetical protein
MKTELRVHWLAARYPMLSEGELADLAQDIKANGQKIPILIDGDVLLDGVLLDGRNRLRACELAGVEPRFEQFPWPNGRDGKQAAIIADITSRNIKRRHLNAGQRAVLYALAYPEPAKLKRAGSLEIKDQELNPATISQARVINNDAPDLVNQVIAGGMYFKTAFEEADRRRAAAKIVAEQMARLHAEAPDLANIVLEEKGMTAAEAIAALDARRKAEVEKQSEEQRRAVAEAAQRRSECEQRTALLQRAITVFNPRNNDPKAYAARLLTEIDVELWPAGSDEASIECWNDAANTLAAMVVLRRKGKR